MVGVTTAGHMLERLISGSQGAWVEPLQKEAIKINETRDDCSDLLGRFHGANDRAQLTEFQEVGFLFTVAGTSYLAKGEPGAGSLFSITSKGKPTLLADTNGMLLEGPQSMQDLAAKIAGLVKERLFLSSSLGNVLGR